MNYFKLLFFYAIGVIDALINFVCSVVGFYPALELSQDYLISKELKRVGTEIDERTEIRLTAKDKADTLVAAAKALDKQTLEEV